MPIVFRTCAACIVQYRYEISVVGLALVESEAVFSSSRTRHIFVKIASTPHHVVVCMYVCEANKTLAVTCDPPTVLLPEVDVVLPSEVEFPEMYRLVVERTSGCFIYAQ